MSLFLDSFLIQQSEFQENKLTGEKKEYCKEPFRKYICKDFSRFHEGQSKCTPFAVCTTLSIFQSKRDIFSYLQNTSKPRGLEIPRLRGFCFVLGLAPRAKRKKQNVCQSCIGFLAIFRLFKDNQQRTVAHQASR